MSRGTSQGLGFGFRAGFLGSSPRGWQERLEREYDLDLISHAPSVEYRVEHTRRAPRVASRQTRLLPDPGTIVEIREP